MSNTPVDLKYTNSHEWVRLETDGVVTVGITEYAQDSLGDIVFVELPEVGKTYEAENNAAVIESVKAASDIYAPITGEIIEVNTSVVDEPDSINKDAYSAWLFKIKPTDVNDVSKLLSADEYKKNIGE